MLRLTSPTGAEISASDRITIDPVTELSFRYLFSNPAEVRISLGVALIDILAAPEVGPGAPGAQDFGVYRRTFDLETLNAQLDGATALQALTKSLSKRPEILSSSSTTWLSWALPPRNGCRSPRRSRWRPCRWSLRQALMRCDAAAVAGQDGVSEFNQRGRGFDRVIGGWIDIGALESPALSTSPGDFDNAVDGFGFLIWQRGFGATRQTHGPRTGRFRPLSRLLARCSSELTTAG